MTLAVHTPKGRKALINEERMRLAAMKRFPELDITKRSGDTNRSDMFVRRDGKLVCIAEFKYRTDAGKRPLTYDYVMKGGYLVTESKLLEGVAIAEQYLVPFYLWVWIEAESKLFMWGISDAIGIVDRSQWTSRWGWTKATINSTKADAYRYNAYLRGDRATVWEMGP